MSDDSDAIEPTSVRTGAEAAGHGAVPAVRDENTPATTGWTSALHGILNFVSLAARVIALAGAAAFLKEQLHLLKARMHDDADRARRLTGHLGQAHVAPRFQAQALEVAADFDRVAEASGEVANAADQMEADARGVRDAHQTEYGGIYEVAQASEYDQPKPGFNEVR
ncbi:conjugal transfer protein TraB [Streptomyces sp. NPDC017529]|uniref:conjugal transfer protein TraB n=1 Tax=Streptomyces sp. NPDC017529 TaxID=3365000 RepID=UPI0037B1E92B